MNAATDCVWRREIVKRKFDDVNRSLSQLRGERNSKTREKWKAGLRQNCDPTSTESESETEVSLSILRDLEQEHSDLSRLLEPLSFISHRCDVSDSPNKENRPTYVSLIEERQKDRKVSQPAPSDQKLSGMLRCLRSMELANKRVVSELEKQRVENERIRKENRELKEAVLRDQHKIESMTVEMEALKRVLEVAKEADQLRAETGPRKSLSPAVLRSLRGKTRGSSPLQTASSNDTAR